MPKRLVLFSQPSPNIWKKLDDVLFPEYLEGMIFAYMPCEGDAVELNAQSAKIWEEYTEKNNAKLVSIDNSKRGSEAEIEINKLKTADILMITGGNTFKLLDHLRKSGLDEAIKEFWKKDRVVIGGFSAGAIILSPSIQTAKTGCPDVNEPGLTDLSALNIVDFEIWPHYESAQELEYKQYREGKEMEVVTIANDEMLVIDK